MNSSSRKAQAEHQRRVRAARAARGERQTNLFLTKQELEFIDHVKRVHGFNDRSAAMREIIAMARGSDQPKKGGAEKPMR